MRLKSEFAREFETAYAAWLPRLEAMKHEMPPRCRPLKKNKLERPKPLKKRDWLRFHPQIHEVFGHDLGYGFGSLDGVEIHR